MGRGAILRRKRGNNEGLATASPGETVSSTMPPPLDLAVIWRAAWLRRIGSLALLAFVLLGATWVLGERDGEVSASGGGYDLTVQFAEVSRPGLDTPWAATIKKRGGFDGPVELRTTARYFDLFDENGLSPDPDAVRQDSKFVVMEFAKPEGEELVVSFDARISPSVQSGHSAETAVLEDGAPVVSVNYDTTVMP